MSFVHNGLKIADPSLIDVCRLSSSVYEIETSTQVTEKIAEERQRQMKKLM
jgi:hypothetical protein